MEDAIAPIVSIAQQALTRIYRQVIQASSKKIILSLVENPDNAQITPIQVDGVSADSQDTDDNVGDMCLA